MAAGIYRGKAREKVAIPLDPVVSVRHRHTSQVANGVLTVNGCFISSVKE